MSIYSNCLFVHCVRVLLQCFDDNNVTMIDEARFNKEHCDDACYKDYSMKGIIISDLKRISHQINLLSTAIYIMSPCPLPYS